MKTSTFIEGIKSKEDIKEATDVGTTKFVDVTITAGGLGNEKNVTIGQLNGKGQVGMDLLKQKGAYIKVPIKKPELFLSSGFILKN